MNRLFTIKKYSGLFLFIFFFVLFNSQKGFAQNSGSDKVYLDSLLNLLTPEEKDSLKLSFGLLDQPPPKNILEISSGISNGNLTKSDNRGNSVNYSKVIFTNTASFTLKNGLGCSYENNITSAPLNAKLTVLQQTVSLYYTYEKYGNSSFDLFINKNFVKDSLPYDATLFDYTFGASYSYQKKYIQPLILASYSFGNFTEKIARPLFTASYDVSIKDFSLTTGIQHQYYFYKLFSKKDELYFIPKILLNSGAQDYKTFNPNRNKFTQRLMNNGFIPRNITSTFQPQSLGFDLECSYGFGKCYLAPNLYFDYYLHSATKRLFTIASLTFGVQF